ncbi:hypothetical protein [Hymenobacter psoromatis]|uniref:hypothetical protein n=1 Tax=Hymenobacter psoromatis TaxID=1484116 RepID=UPI001CBF7450|nr:hypothetical protein [Hymenobacter psoromatis]
MKILTFLRFATYAFISCLLAAATAQAQDNHFVASSEPSHKQQNTEITFAGAPTTDISDILVVQPVNLSAVPTPEEGASFYDDSRKDLSQSLAWILDLNAVSPTYWNLYTESRIRLKMKDYTGAKAAAEKSYQLALKGMPASREYIMLSADVISKVHALTKP